MPDYLSLAEWKPKVKVYKDVKDVDDLLGPLGDYAKAKRDEAKQKNAHDGLMTVAEKVKKKNAKNKDLAGDLDGVVSAAEKAAKGLAKELEELKAQELVKQGKEKLEQAVSFDPELVKHLLVVRNIGPDKARHFVIALGKPAGMAISKVPVTKKHKQQARKWRKGKGKLLEGTCYGEKGKYIFDFGPVKPPAGLAKMIKGAALSQAEKSIKLKVRGGGVDLDDELDTAELEDLGEDNPEDDAPDAAEADGTPDAEEPAEADGTPDADGAAEATIPTPPPRYPPAPRRRQGRLRPAVEGGHRVRPARRLPERRPVDAGRPVPARRAGLLRRGEGRRRAEGVGDAPRHGRGGLQGGRPGRRGEDRRRPEGGGGEGRQEERPGLPVHRAAEEAQGPRQGGDRGRRRPRGRGQAPGQRGRDVRPQEGLRPGQQGPRPGREAAGRGGWSRAAGRARRGLVAPAQGADARHPRSRLRRAEAHDAKEVKSKFGEAQSFAGKGGSAGPPRPDGRGRRPGRRVGRGVRGGPVAGRPRAVASGLGHRPSGGPRRRRPARRRHEGRLPDRFRLRPGPRDDRRDRVAAHRRALGGDELDDALGDLLKAAPDAREGPRSKAAALAARHRALVETDALLQAIDTNPFVPVDIRGTLAASLSELTTLLRS